MTVKFKTLKYRDMKIYISYKSYIWSYKVIFETSAAKNQINIFVDFRETLRRNDGAWPYLDLLPEWGPRNSQIKAFLGVLFEGPIYDSL